MNISLNSNYIFNSLAALPPFGQAKPINIWNLTVSFNSKGGGQRELDKVVRMKTGARDGKIITYGLQMFIY